MDDFKEFQGKSLDEAIRAACSYFDAQREKLEIDIIQDAKNGIFGLVGARPPCTAQAPRRVAPGTRRAARLRAEGQSRRNFPRAQAPSGAGSPSASRQPGTEAAV